MHTDHHVAPTPPGVAPHTSNVPLAQTLMCLTVWAAHPARP